MFPKKIKVLQGDAEILCINVQTCHKNLQFFVSRKKASKKNKAEKWIPSPWNNFDQCSKWWHQLEWYGLPHKFRLTWVYTFCREIWWKPRVSEQWHGNMSELRSCTATLGASPSGSERSLTSWTGDTKAAGRRRKKVIYVYYILVIPKLSYGASYVH